MTLHPSCSTVTIDELRAMLADQQPVTVLDIRPAADRAEWVIPGSRHIDAYEALKAGDPHALADAAITKDAPVVTVCGAGKVSITAMEQL
ncbi:MAG: rhodanese-like domain-containing protein, partial [Chloroflexi bacterium]|nr:rhodanese-like domain-containing protein [Chloroflexota bacterium]